jgi:hypothetical protein
VTSDHRCASQVLDPPRELLLRNRECGLKFKVWFESVEQLLESRRHDAHSFSIVGTSERVEQEPSGS